MVRVTYHLLNVTYPHYVLIDMAATMERLDEYKKYNAQFCKRVLDYLSIVFAAQVSIFVSLSTPPLTVSGRERCYWEMTTASTSQKAVSSSRTTEPSRRFWSDTVACFCTSRKWTKTPMRRYARYVSPGLLHVFILMWCPGILLRG